MPRFTALSTPLVRALQTGGPDCHGQPAERAVSDGAGNTFRYCLRQIPKGAPMLILAHRAFPDPQPDA